MIVTFILTIGYNVYNGMISLLPVGSLPTGIASGMTTIGSYLFKFNALLPVSTLFQVLGAVVVFEAAIFLFRLLAWIWRQVPLIGGR